MGEWSQRVFLTSSCRTILVLVIITFGMDRISVPHFLFVEVNCTSITQQTELLCNAGSSGLIIVDINNNITLYVIVCQSVEYRDNQYRRDQRGKLWRLVYTPLALGETYEMTAKTHAIMWPLHPQAYTSKHWLHMNSLCQWWLKLKLLKRRDRLQKRRIFTSRIISLVAACSTNAFLSGKPCSSKFN